MKLITDEMVQIEEAERSTSEESLTYPVHPPTTYLPRGKTHARFYRDLEDNYIHWAYVHRFGHDLVQCVGPLRCKICRELWAHPACSSQKRGYHSRLTCMCYAWLDHRRAKSKAKLREQVLLWGTEQFGDKLVALVRELGPGEKRQSFFDPAVNQLFVEIYRGSSPTQVEVSLSREIASPVPSLPQGFPPLSHCLVSADEESGRALLENLLIKLETGCNKRL